MLKRNMENILELRLFTTGNYYTNTTGDNGTGTQGTAISGGSDKANDLTAEMKTFYDRQLIKLASANLVHDQFGQKKPIPKNGGKTIEFRKYDSFPKALTPLVEGVTPNGRKMSVTPITSTVKQYGDYVELSDMLLLTAIDNNLVEANELLGDQAGLTLDTVTREVLAGGTNAMMSNGRSGRAQLTADDKLSVLDIKKAVRSLKVNHAAKINGDYVAIIHPDVAFDLMCDPEWIEASKYAGSTQIFNGEIGKIAGVRFVETSEAKIFANQTTAAGSGKSVYATLVLGANAYGVTEIEGGGLEFIVKQLGSGQDPLNQRATAGWKATKTAEILVEQYMVRIESLSTFNSTDGAPSK